MQKINDTDVWRQLTDHHRQLVTSGLHIRDLFDQEPDRVQRLTLGSDAVTLDLSRHLMTAETWRLLHELAASAGVHDQINAMFAGQHVNRTERRPALHVALRGHSPALLPEAAGQVNDVLQRMAALVTAVHSGSWRGHSGQLITDVVNLGIGGSDLGPAMVSAALRPWHHSRVRTHFVSNVDPTHLRATLRDLDPATTLFIVASKSFTTLETLQNAIAARHWCELQGVAHDCLHKHFVAVSSNVQAAAEFGIAEDNIYPMWDWVGGRFSLWSAIGLAIALATDMDCFHQLLAGARSMDQHFLEAPAEQNLPVALALMTVWYRNFCGTSNQVVLPYAQDLHLLPAYLQQLDMESLGKSVDVNGHRVDYATGTVVWGSAGTNGQHSFHQLLHQGTEALPAEFIAVARAARAEDDKQHRWLLANCLSQSQALMCGRSLEQILAELQQAGVEPDQARQLAPHQVVPGNRPSTTVLVEQLTPYSLGELLALYEHRVFVQSVIWNINTFDQWGVALGKQLSGQVFDALGGNVPHDDAPHDDIQHGHAKHGTMDPSTRALIERCRQWRARGEED